MQVEWTDEGRLEGDARLLGAAADLATRGAPVRNTPTSEPFAADLDDPWRALMTLGHVLMTEGRYGGVDGEQPGRPPGLSAPRARPVGSTEAAQRLGEPRSPPRGPDVHPGPFGPTRQARSRLSNPGRPRPARAAGALRETLAPQGPSYGLVLSRTTMNWAMQQMARIARVGSRWSVVPWSTAPLLGFAGQYLKVKIFDLEELSSL